MITLFDPRLWLAAVLCIVLSFAAGNWHGSTEATKVAAAAEEVRTAAALAGLAAENDRVLRAERKLRTDDRTAFDKYTLEKDHAKAETDRLISDLRRDVVRLRVPIRAPREAAADASGSPPGGPGEEGYAELTINSSEFLVGLLARGDEGIRKHAEVVDRYERLRIACTAEDPPP